MRPLTRTLRQARNPRLLAASAATGVVVALVVAAFETLALHVVLERVLRQNLAVLALAPVLGIAASKLVLRTVGGGTSGATSDEYVRAFHERHPSLPFRFLPAKLLAGVATIGSGGAVGLEGPAAVPSARAWAGAPSTSTGRPPCSKGRSGICWAPSSWVSPPGWAAGASPGWCAKPSTPPTRSPGPGGQWRPPRSWRA